MVEISAGEGAQSVYRVAITPADVGRRVGVRRHLDDGRSGLGDVLGELLSWSEGTLVIRTRDGGDVSVDQGLLVSGKLLPPPPPRRRERSA